MTSFCLKSGPEEPGRGVGGGREKDKDQGNMELVL